MTATAGDELGVQGVRVDGFALAVGGVDEVYHCEGVA